MRNKEMPQNPRRYSRRPDGNVRPPTFYQQMRDINRKFNTVSEEYKTLTGVPLELSGSFGIHISMGLEYAKNRREQLQVLRFAVDAGKDIVELLKENKNEFDSNRK